MKFRLRRRLWPLLLLGLAFGLRLYHLDFQSLWWDEGHSIFVAAQPVPLIPTLPAMDVHPPAYFILLHLWMAVAGQSEFSLRYLSVLFSLLAVALLWRFAATLSRRLAAPFLAALFAAVSPLYIAYAQEVRSYALITCLALAGTFILWKILFAGSNSPVAGRRSAVISYILLAAACLYTHYFTIFLLLFHNLAWLVWALFPGRHIPPHRSAGQSRIEENSKERAGTYTFPPLPPSSFFHSSRSSRLVLWLAAQIGILLLFAPQLILALRQVTSYTNPNLTPPGLSEFITRTWQAYTVGLTIEPGLARWGMIAIAGVVAVIFLLQPGSSISPLRPLLFLAGWFIIPLAAYFIVLQRQSSFEPRYMILVTPALFLLLALGLSNFQLSTFKLQHHIPHASRLTFYALSTIPFIALLTGLYSYYTDETYFKDDSAGVAAWLAAETTANDLVYLDVPHPFHYYIAKGQIAAPSRYLFVDIHTAADILTREAAGRNRLFWVAWRGSDTDPRGVIPFLAQKYGQKLGQRDFRGYRVEWFSLPPAKTVFSLPTDLPPLNATFGDVIKLDGAAYGGYPPSDDAVSVAHPAWATLHFTLLRHTGVDYRVSVRLAGQDGRIVAQVDKDLLNDRHFRTSAWPLADPALNQAINVYTLPLAAGTPPGSYRLEVIVYDARPPYPGEGVTGLASADGTAAVIGRITVIP